MYRNTPVMHATAIWYEVVGGSETAEAPNCYDYALRGRRELCVHDRGLRVGVFDASESYGHTRRARRVGYMAVTVGGSENSPRPTSNFRGNRPNLVIDLGPNSGRSRVDLGSISVLVDLGSAEIKFTSSSSGLPVNSFGRLSLHR